MSVRQRSELPMPERCSLYQALLWVSDFARPIGDKHFLSLPPPSTFNPTDEHKGELLQALLSGRVRAEGIFWGEGGSPYFEDEDRTLQLRPDFWERNAVSWKESRLQAPNWFGAPGAFNYITVSTSELMEMFPHPSEPAPVSLDTTGNSSQKKTTPTPTTAQRGRPEKYNWTEFYVEVIVRADLDNLPESQAELERSMADWCEQKWGIQPGDSTIREKISPIYNHLRKVRK
jgi:hypothetical protein